MVLPAEMPQSSLCGEPYRLLDVQAPGLDGLTTSQLWLFFPNSPLSNLSLLSHFDFWLEMIRIHACEQPKVTAMGVNCKSSWAKC